MNTNLRTLLLASTALSFLMVAPAQAADKTTDAIKALQEQVNALQKQLVDMQVKEKAKAEAPAAAPVATADAAKKEVLPGVSVKLGGYIALEGVHRDHNQFSGTSSSLNTSIPWQNQQGANQDEFHLSSNSSRLSVLAEGKVDKDMSLAAYAEGDLMGANTNSNSVQSNSYSPRLRHAYGTIDRNDWGLRFLVGQSWSLASMFKSGLTPRQEAGPLVIDSVGTPGYVYTRAPQIRVVKDFADNKAHLGLSFEDPEINLSGLRCTTYASGNCAGAPVTVGTGAGGMAGNQSADFAPDVIGKFAYDSSIGHFEAFGLTRFFRASFNPAGGAPFTNQYAVGYGGGAAAFIPVIAKKLEVQANFLAGRGIGRYSAGQMPDLTFTDSGDIKPLTQMVGMFGLVGHPTTKWDVYLYAGAEKVMRENTTNQYLGYGNTATSTAGCYAQGGTCNAQTETLWSVTPGFWHTAYKGDFGNIKLGAQYQFTRKDAFSGSTGQAPHAYENVVMTSFRYSPF